MKTDDNWEKLDEESLSEARIRAMTFIKATSGISAVKSINVNLGLSFRGLKVKNLQPN